MKVTFRASCARLMFTHYKHPTAHKLAGLKKKLRRTGTQMADLCRLAGDQYLRKNRDPRDAPPMSAQMLFTTQPCISCSNSVMPLCGWSEVSALISSPGARAGAHTPLMLVVPLLAQALIERAPDRRRGILDFGRVVRASHVRADRRGERSSLQLDPVIAGIAR